MRVRDSAARRGGGGDGRCRPPAVGAVHCARSHRRRDGRGLGVCVGTPRQNTASRGGTGRARRPLTAESDRDRGAAPRAAGDDAFAHARSRPCRSLAPHRLDRPAPFDPDAEGIHAGGRSSGAPDPGGHRQVARSPGIPNYSITRLPNYTITCPRLDCHADTAGLLRPLRFDAEGSRCDRSARRHAGWLCVRCRRGRPLARQRHPGSRIGSDVRGERLRRDRRRGTRSHRAGDGDSRSRT